jgi:hypothetical protein
VLAPIVRKTGTFRQIEQKSSTRSSEGSGDRVLQTQLKHFEIDVRSLGVGGARAGRLALRPLTPDLGARIANLEAAMASLHLLAPLSRSQVVKTLLGSSRRAGRVAARNHNHFSVFVVERRGK